MVYVIFSVLGLLGGIVVFYSLKAKKLAKTIIENTKTIENLTEEVKRKEAEVQVKRELAEKAKNKFEENRRKIYGEDK